MHGIMIMMRGTVLLLQLQLIMMTRNTMMMTMTKIITTATKIILTRLSKSLLQGLIMAMTQPRSQSFCPPRRGWAPTLSSAEKSPGNEVGRCDDDYSLKSFKFTLFFTISFTELQ